MGEVDGCRDSVAQSGFIPNWPFVGASGRRWKIDAAKPDVRLAVEVDSARWHGGPSRNQAEVDKHNDLHDAGWLSVKVTPDDIRRRPADVVRRIKAAIARAESLDP